MPITEELLVDFLEEHQMEAEDADDLEDEFFSDDPPPAR